MEVNIQNKSKIAELYLILENFTKRHNNIKFGCYISNKFGGYEFMEFSKMYKTKEHFLKIASGKLLFEKSNADEFTKSMFGITTKEEILSFLELDKLFIILFESPSFLKQIIGYKFKNALSFQIEPQSIIDFKNSNNDSLEIYTSKFTLCLDYNYGFTVS